MIFLEKTSQALLHMTVAFAISYGFTGSLAFGGLMAVLEPICNVLLLPLHDKMWRRIKYRHRMQQREERLHYDKNAYRLNQAHHSNDMDIDSAMTA